MNSALDFKNKKKTEISLKVLGDFTDHFGNFGNFGNFGKKSMEFLDEKFISMPDGVEDEINMRLNKNLVFFPL